MQPFDPTTTVPTTIITTKIQRIATVAIWLSTAATALALVVIFYFTSTALSDPAALATELSLQLDIDPDPVALNQSQAVMTTAIWLVTDVIGVILLMSVRQLFVGLKRDGLFTILSAEQFRRIGWLVFSLGPVSIVLNAITAMLLYYWASPTGLHVEISLEDTDVYAIVIGLVIVAVGHIMVSAAQLSEDHRAIV